jgi:hypothetical protein
MKRQVVFYRSMSGECPVEVFLDSLPGKVAHKITCILLNSVFITRCNIIKCIIQCNIIPEFLFRRCGTFVPGVSRGFL